MMERAQEIFIFASPEIQELLADNQTDFMELLRQEGITISRGSSQDPAMGKGSAYKEPATVIIASAALVVALTPIITRAIEALSHKSVLVQESVLVPVEDSRGDVVRDATGQPVLQWRERPHIIESLEKPQAESSVEIKGPLGITISYKTNR
jgi:hypothetical protein